jgi:anaerobic selenocysteine-containing dehydrogenase
MIPTLRALHPDPLVEIHPETAKAFDIKNGDWVYIETPRGRIMQKAKITSSIDMRVVHAEHGWWFPEEKDPSHGWNKSNVDILTENKPPLDPYMGSTNLRVLLCKIYPV